MYSNETLAFAQFYCKALHVKHIHAVADLMGRTQGDMDVVTLRPSWQLNIGMTKNVNNWFSNFKPRMCLRQQGTL